MGNLSKDVLNKETRGKSLKHWKENAEEDYFEVPISVLKYITILEEMLETSQPKEN